MTEFDGIRDNDPQVLKIKKETLMKLQKLEIERDDQIKTARKGMPIPTLSLGKQFQNTTKERGAVHDQKNRIRDQIEREQKKALRKREKELSEKYPKAYKQHLIEKQKERMKENQKSLEKDREHGR